MKGFDHVNVNSRDLRGRSENKSKVSYFGADFVNARSNPLVSELKIHSHTESSVK